MNPADYLAQSSDVGFGPVLLHAAVFKELIPFVVTPLLLLGIAHFRSLRTVTRRAYVVLVIATLIGFGGLCAARAVSNVIELPDWDLKAFWMYGKVAAAGENFYDPAAFHQVAEQVDLRPDDPLFTDVVLDVGFLYPPPTMLLIAPFGYLTPRAAALAWYALEAAAFAVVILLLWQEFARREDGWLGLAGIAALFLILRPTYSTVVFGQTNFQLLAMLLLFCRNQRLGRGGVYLAIGIVIKPFAGILLAYLAIRRQWRALVFALATIAALCAVTLIVFGVEPFVSYWAANPVSRAPGFIYAIEENQSILAEIVRLANLNPDLEIPLLHPYYLTVVALIGAATFAIARMIPRDQDHLALAVALSAVLLVYPQSWEHYTVLLILPILILWRDRDRLGLGTATAVVVLSAAYALVRYDHGSLAVFGTSLLWMVLLAACAARVYRSQARFVPALAIER